MKCPLLAVGYMSYGDNKVWEKAHCLKEECAWWDDIVEQCSLKTIGWSLSGILGYLSLIEDKMPHEEQFRR